MELSLATELGKWFVRVTVQKAKSDTGLVGWLEFLPLEEQRAYLETDKVREDAVKEMLSLLYMIQYRN